MMWDEFEKSKLAQGVKPLTLRGYRSILSSFREWMIERHGPRFHVEPKHIEGYFTYLRSVPANRNHPFSPPKTQPISAYRLRNIHVAMCSYYSWLEERGARESPMKHIKAPKLPQDVIEIYTHEETDRVLEHIDSRNSPNNLRDTTIVQLFMATGLRASELLGITRADVSLSGHRIKVNGKGGKERMVPFNGTSGEPLSEYMAGLHGDMGCIFPITYHRCLEMFTENCEASEVEPRGLHCLRHTFACRFLLAGGSPLDLKYILGHSSLAMVDRYSRWVRQQTALNSYALVADRL